MKSADGNAVELDQIRFSYRAGGNGAGASLLYEDFTFRAPLGSITALMGASGTGKSTLGRLAAGMMNPERGSVRWSSQFESRADVLYIDQEPINSVFPWQDVRRNIEYPLRKLGWRDAAVRERTSYFLSEFGLEHVEESFPENLSGGELQRLALARGLSWRPKLVVLDEPFSALDRQTKERVFSNIYRLMVEGGMTLLLISHNLSDALSLATRCVVLGNRPVEVVADVAIEAPYPRNLNAPEYRAAEDALFDLLRHGLI